MASIGDLRDASNFDRLCMLKAGLAMVRERPVFGLGPDLVRERYALYRPLAAPRFEVPHLHNSWLQIAAEQGLPSLAAYLVLTAASATVAWRAFVREGGHRGPRADLHVGVLVALLAFNLAGLFENNWGDTRCSSRSSSCWRSPSASGWPAGPGPWTRPARRTSDDPLRRAPRSAPGGARAVPQPRAGTAGGDGGDRGGRGEAGGQAGDRGAGRGPPGGAGAEGAVRVARRPQAGATRWTISWSMRRGRSASTSGPRPAGSPTACCSAARSAVYAVDVGYGQLDLRLRNDPRVVVMERINARNLAPDALPERCGLVTVDVSFISLLKVVPALVAHLAPGGLLVPMIKPQFEAGRGAVGKGGSCATRPCAAG